jgi:hypothetical protein
MVDTGAGFERRNAALCKFQVVGTEAEALSGVRVAGDDAVLLFRGGDGQVIERRITETNNADVLGRS